MKKWEGLTTWTRRKFCMVQRSLVIELMKKQSKWTMPCFINELKTSNRTMLCTTANSNSQSTWLDRMGIYLWQCREAMWSGLQREEISKANLNEYEVPKSPQSNSFIPYFHRSFVSSLVASFLLVCIVMFHEFWFQMSYCYATTSYFTVNIK